MRILRQGLPTNIAAVLFCTKQTVVVEQSLDEAVTLAAVAIVIERCDGLFAVVMMAEVIRVATMVA